MMTEFHEPLIQFFLPSMLILPSLPLSIIPGTIRKSLIRENAWLVGIDIGWVVGMDTEMLIRQSESNTHQSHHNQQKAVR